MIKIEIKIPITKINFHIATHHFKRLKVRLFFNIYFPEQYYLSSIKFKLNKLKLIKLRLLKQTLI